MTATGERSLGGASPGTADDPAYREMLTAMHRNSSRMRWHLPDAEFRLERDRLTWTLDGQTQSWLLNEIRSIRLEAGEQAGAGTKWSARIVFRDWSWIDVMSLTPDVKRDPGRERAYRRFVEELHRRLKRHGSPDLALGHGDPSARRTIVLCALIAIGLIIVGVPFVALFILGEPAVLLTMLAGVLLIWPFANAWGQNAPGEYALDALPQEKLPPT